MRKKIVSKEHGAKNIISPRIVKSTKEEALEEAKSEAIAKGISPSAVMHSAPDGAVTGDDK